MHDTDLNARKFYDRATRTFIDGDPRRFGAWR